MKTPSRLFFRRPGSFFAAAAIIGTFWGAHPLAALTGPESKLYVSDLKGHADLNTVDAVTPLTKKSVFSAQGSTILTSKDSNDTMVYSNGSGIYLDANTRVNIKKFVQEPFTPNRTDLDVEPSISQTMAYVSYGCVGLCTSKLVAGSNMVYTTPQATLDIRGKRLVIEVSDTETCVSVIEGDVTVRASAGTAGTVLHGGDEAIVASDPATQTSSIVHVGRIPDSRKAFLSERSAMACIARRTVYFETVERKGAAGDTTEEIQASDVVPANKPTDFTISPSQLPQ